jgi:hypothetical protein
MARLFILFACLLTTMAEAQLKERSFGPSVADQRRAGELIVADLLSMRPAQDSEIRGVFEIRAGRQRRQVPVVCRILADKKEWETIYETASTDHTPAEKLVIRHCPGQPNQYFYARAAKPGESPGEPKRLRHEEIFVPLGGSDFWLSDLGLDFFHWPDQRRVGGEMRLGRPCHVIESRIEQNAPLAVVKSYVDQEEQGVLIAEAYDGAGKLIKEFTLSGSSFKKVDGRWQLSEMKIRSPRINSQTILRFDLPRE